MVPISSYVSSVNALVAEYPSLTHVYVATDSPSAITALRQALASPSRQLMVLEEEERSANLAYSLVRDTHKMNVTRFAHDAFVNAFLLVVGTLPTSHTHPH